MLSKLARQKRIVAACARPVDTVAADMRAGRILTAEEALGYGLIDVIAYNRSQRPSDPAP